MSSRPAALPPATAGSEQNMICLSAAATCSESHFAVSHGLVAVHEIARSVDAGHLSARHREDRRTRVSLGGRAIVEDIRIFSAVEHFSEGGTLYTELAVEHGGQEQ